MHAVANSAAAIMAGSVIATGAAAVSVSLWGGRSEGGWLRVGLESAGEGRGRVVRAFERLRALMDLAMIARRAGFSPQKLRAWLRGRARRGIAMSLGERSSVPQFEQK